MGAEEGGLCIPWSCCRRQSLFRMFKNGPIVQVYEPLTAEYPQCL